MIWSGRSSKRTGPGTYRFPANEYSKEIPVDYDDGILVSVDSRSENISFTIAGVVGPESTHLNIDEAKKFIAALQEAVKVAEYNEEQNRPEE